MRVGITGASGFIGKNLLKACISRDYQVNVLTRSSHKIPLYSNKLKIVIGDLMAPDSLNDFVDEIDVLYHCAGEIKDRESMYAVHVSGTNNLIDAAKNKIKHWVQLSSVGVYGPVMSGKVTEDSPPQPVGEYERTKYMSDEMLIEKSAQANFTYTILRPSNVFGNDMRNQSLYSLISMIDKRLFFFVGKNKAFTNYLHVDNVIEALILCGTNKSAHGNVYNLSNCMPLSDVVNEVSRALGRENYIFTIPEPIARWFAHIFGNIPGFPLKSTRVDALTKQSTYPINKIQNELCYKHIVTSSYGIKKLVAEWQRKKGVI